MYDLQSKYIRKLVIQSSMFANCLLLFNDSNVVVIVVFFVSRVVEQMPS